MIRRGIRLTTWGSVGVIVLLTILSGCAGVRLYDKSKADVSAAVKKKYVAADIVKTVEVQRKNLDALQAEELKIVRDNLRLQLDFALLELVDNNSPMAVTWREEIERPMEALGFTNGENLRNFLIGGDLVALRGPQLERLSRLIKRGTGKAPQRCELGKSLPDALELPANLTREAADRATARYKIYKAACIKLQEAYDLLELAQKGRLKKAKSDWQAAKTALAVKNQQMAAARTAVVEVASKHKAAVEKVKEAGAKGEAVRKAIKEKADKFRSALSEGTKLAPQVLSEERLSAIVTLLKAAAGEQTKIEDDPELAKAVLMVNGLSSLSGDVAELVAEAKAPSVSNLLIELQHQTVLLEHARAEQTLQQRRIDILETKYDAYREEGDLLLAFRDALCSFASQSAGQGHPGGACDGFTVSEDGKVCQVPDKDPIQGCALSKPWNTFLKKLPPGDAGREFFKALAAYTRLFPVRASQIEQDFNLIDLKHRENLASREMALRAWNNLAAVPIDQLDAYYQSGLKPEAIADLIVKALGFTAITVGVSQ